MVRKRTLGGAIGYSSGRNSSSLKEPPGKWAYESNVSIANDDLGCPERALSNKTFQRQLHIP